ncbi:protein kinase domain-containing protein [Candidatus Poriferisocius sp.]|uniref:Stk1 family PASTA domain-containing Ser/Thr kinase n=1 Tax=Candidatus Poriferisocius sp. TaxID=3101276 RepID=UPI003B01319F
MSQGSGEAGVIGQVLGGRYRLVTHIGAGRFTHVFLAYDLSQSRRVAVKLLADEVLPDGWTRDGVFASRFLEAAEEAAAVAHPHLAAIRDWGDSDIGLYVVGDYLEGGSLQGMLDAGHLLSPSQTLMVGLEVTRGLEHIHRRGLVHRDVRPSNILFDSRGRSRLADLGTSWILTSSEAGGVLTARSVFSAIDAVRYASPEQAQGLSPDHKSDVYSLVLVLTEALSGRVPFESDDPEYTQMAKMSRQLDLAGQFDRLGRVLEMAGRPERDDRPSAHDLSAALLAAAETLPRPGPLPLTKARPEIPDTDETAVAGAPAKRPPEKSTQPKAGRPAFRRLLAAAIALVLLGGAGFGAYALWKSQFGTQTQPVPDLAGAEEADLLRIESEFGWVLNRLEQRQDGTVAGQVLGQAPQPGTGLEEGETVTVWVSLGPELVAIPSNIVGLAVEDAGVSLDVAGLSLGEISQRYDETMIEGVVVEVDELFSEVEPGASVDLVVSLGPSPRVVPDIDTGSSLAVARERLEELRLGVLEWPVHDNLVEADHVVRVEPPPGTEVAADTVITVVISAGPEQVRVPAMATLGVADATGVLEEAGLCLGEVEGPLDSEILASNPPADAVVDFGTCVDLFTRPEEQAGESSEEG